MMDQPGAMHMSYATHVNFFSACIYVLFACMCVCVRACVCVCVCVLCVCVYSTICVHLSFPCLATQDVWPLAPCPGFCTALHQLGCTNQSKYPKCVAFLKRILWQEYQMSKE